MSVPDETVPSAQPTPPASPHAPAAPTPPQRWAGRVAVPGAHGPGQNPLAAPTARPAFSAAGGPFAVAPPLRRRHRRRVLTALLALVLVVAVPVVSAYVSYKLASGENPFEWPPTVDYQKIFGS